MDRTIPRRTAVITGAAGGMGQAVARFLGMEMDLILSDVNGGRLNLCAAALEEEGYTIVGVVTGFLEDDSVLRDLIKAQSRAGRLGALIHTAGLSPAMAEWQAILRVNIVATEKLLRAFEPILTPGAVAVLIASIAGYKAKALPELDALLAAPLAEDFLERIEPLLESLCIPGDAFGLKTQAYFASKREVIRLCERRAPAWAKKGARIISVSPGTTWTPMARREVEENPLTRAVVEATPLGRWGTAMDIANAVRFLVSDAASFITGCDLRVDGGATPATNGPIH